ncbi:MAG: hypothetical protein CME07_05755 [Gemmatimonadetes bacterium]|nr:hypothetical protein [Gemmatimonadota bacterium]
MPPQSRGPCSPISFAVPSDKESGVGNLAGGSFRPLSADTVRASREAASIIIPFERAAGSTLFVSFYGE